MDTEWFTVHVKASDVYKDISEDVETRFYTSNFERDRPISKGKNKKPIGLMKVELGRQVIKEFTGIFSYLKENSDEDQKGKRRKKVYYEKKI